MVSILPVGGFLSLYIFADAASVLSLLWLMRWRSFFAEVHKLQTVIALQCPTDIPLTGEQQ